LPRVPIKSFTVKFGLRTKTASSANIADGISFNFGQNINTNDVVSEKGITKGLAVAFDTYYLSNSDPSWSPGISIRWDGVDLATQKSTSSNSFFSKSETDFSDVTITLKPTAYGGGAVATVTVEYKTVKLTADVPYTPTLDTTWRMLFGARTGTYYTEQAINQIRVTGTAAQLNVVSAYGNGQIIQQAGTYNPAGFDYTYDPAMTKPGTMVFNGSAANTTNVFLLTRDNTDQNGAIVLNNLPRVPITEFTARISLRLNSANTNSKDLGDGVSFNFGPNIATNSVVDEKGISTGLAVSLDPSSCYGENATPGMAIRWNGSVMAAASFSFPARSDTNFHDVIIQMQPASAAGLSTVSVQYNGREIEADVPYAPGTNEVWGVIIGARTEKTQVTARGENSPNETAVKAFDGSTSTKWLDFMVPDGTDAKKSWIQVLYPHEQMQPLTSYTITSANDAAERDPSAWEVYGVDSSFNLTLLNKQTNQSFASRGLAQSYSVSSTTPYRGYRLVITKVSNPSIANSVQLAELQLNGSTPTQEYFASEAAIRLIQLSGTSWRPAPPSQPVGILLSPSSGVHEVTDKGYIVLQAPEFVYLDSYGRELNPTEENVNSIAHYRARLKDPAATVTPSGGATAYGISKGGTIYVDRDTTVTWNWAVDYLGEVNSGTGNITGLAPTDITTETDQLGRDYLEPGSTQFDSTVKRRVISQSQGNVSFDSRWYVMENAPNSPERYLQLAGDGDHLRVTAATPVLPAGATNYTVEFWARRNVTKGTGDQVVLGMGSHNGSGQRLLAGFGGDGAFFISDGGRRVSALASWTDDSWHHWAAVCRGTGASNSVALYRDSVLVQQSADVLAPFRGDGEVTIGARAVGPYATAFFSGGVNNVRVWDRTLERPDLQAALATSQFSNSVPAVRLEMPFDTVSANLEGGVMVEHLTGPAGLTRVADLAGSYTVQDSYVTNNFSLPSKDQVPESAAGQGTNAWHFRTRWVLTQGVRPFFILSSSGGAQLWIDGQLSLEKQLGDSSPASGSVSLAPGNHVIEVWMIDPGGPRSLSLAPTLADKSLFLVASDLLARREVTASSTEGHGLQFVARGFEGLFPANTPGSTMLAAIQPGFRLGLTSIEGGQDTVRIHSSGTGPLHDWRRVFWGWDKSFQFKIGVICAEKAGTAGVSKLPYFAGEVAEANVDARTNNIPNSFGDGVVPVFERWLKEGERLTVGTVYRTPDRLYTLSGISGAFNLFADIQLDGLVDGFRPGGVSREYTFPAVTGPGSLNFTYERTIHRVSLPLGQALDVSSLSAVNTNLYPELPEGSTNLVITLDGPPASVTAPAVKTSDPGPGGVGAGWVWDYVGRKWHPTKPGKVTIAWPDLNGRTNTIEVTARFPTEAEARSGFGAWEYKDGSRHGSSNN
ncbi:MAG: LamG-like jellyroll fold domain-containing protein, partial [Verrucomicrobiota bacterium]